ncbi:2895_t:CDS:2 [Acaulospora morrowiae]|uniref:magnesium chelatase n=1 Tax=Acaulospora morrowiae TaxID=94023 RepID=A0A9N9AKL9_9GLOM|nr:2895_t:CDS:2 [Acaulospora morrowiae]
MLSETSLTKNWLKIKLQNIKRITGLQFSDDVLISILICLISGDKHLILTCKQENTDELRTMLEQIFHHIFGLTCSTVTCDPSQTTADFITNLFSRPKDDNNAFAGYAEDVSNRLKPQKSIKSFKTVSSTKSTERKLSYDIKRLKRRSNISNLTDDSHLLSSVYNDNMEPSIADSGESNIQKSRERVRTADSVKDSPFVSARPPSPQIHWKNITTSQPIDIPDRPSSRPSLSINTTGFSGSPRKNMYHPHFVPQSQSPATPSDYAFSKKKHESVATSSYEPHSPYIMHSRKLAQVAIIEYLTDANEIIHAFIMEEILVKKQIIDKSTTYNLPTPFILIALLPATSSKPNLPNYLIDRFFISYTYEGMPGVGKYPITPSRKNSVIKPTEIEELSKKMDQVTVHNDMQRYIRDVVVGLRTHRLVKGGLTARASSDFVTLVKALAAIFQRSYATPELVLFASEKVFSHRLILREFNDDKSTMYGTNMTTLLKARSLAPKIPTSSDVVADVLQAVWPPV